MIEKNRQTDKQTKITNLNLKSRYFYKKNFLIINKKRYLDIFQNDGRKIDKLTKTGLKRAKKWLKNL